MFVVIVTYKKSLDVIEKHLTAHREYLELGYQKNYLIASGPQNPRTGGIILSQLTDIDQLLAYLAGDPFNLQDIAEYQVIEFSPVKFHPDFAKFV